MFYTDMDGWCPVTEAYLAFSSAVEANPDAAENDGGATAESPEQRREQEINEERLRSALILKALRRLDQVGILLPSGIIAKGTTDLIAGCPNLKGSKALDVDLMVGTVGSGTLWDTYNIASDEDPVLHKIELERRYGILLGCPVMVRADKVNAALSSVFPWPTVGLDLSPEQQGKPDEAANGSKDERSKPGPKGWHHGLFKHMVRKEFAPRIARGDYIGKHMKEANSDASVWLRELTDEEVPVETVDDWMRDLFRPGDVGINSNPKGRNANPVKSTR